MAEVYAGFLSHTDHEIGRLLDFLEETGQRENTIIVLVSDNGARRFFTIALGAAGERRHMAAV